MKYPRFWVQGDKVSIHIPSKTLEKTSDKMIKTVPVQRTGHDHQLSKDFNGFLGDKADSNKLTV